MSRLKCDSVGFVMVCLKRFTLLSNTLIEQQGVEQRVLSGQAVSCQFNLSYLLFMIRVNSLLCVLDKNRKQSISKMHY